MQVSLYVAKQERDIAFLVTLINSASLHRVKTDNGSEFRVLKINECKICYALMFNQQDSFTVFQKLVFL